MPAPAGAYVGLFVDLVARVHVGDIIETTTGRRYQVGWVRVQQTGKRAGRQHLRARVLGADETTCGISATTHRISWYKRKARKKARRR